MQRWDDRRRLRIVVLALAVVAAGCAGDPHERADAALEAVSLRYTDIHDLAVAEAEELSEAAASVDSCSGQLWSVHWNRFPARMGEDAEEGLRVYQGYNGIRGRCGALRAAAIQLRHSVEVVRDTSTPEMIDLFVQTVRPRLRVLDGDSIARALDNSDDLFQQLESLAVLADPMFAFADGGVAAANFRDYAAARADRRVQMDEILAAADAARADRDAFAARWQELVDLHITGR